MALAPGGTTLIGRSLGALAADFLIGIVGFCRLPELGSGNDVIRRPRR